MKDLGFSIYYKKAYLPIISQLGTKLQQEAFRIKVCRLVNLTLIHVCTVITMVRMF